MKKFQLDLTPRGGVLRSEPRVLPTGLDTIELSHAMDRPPELCVLQCQAMVATNGWSAGEAWSTTQQWQNICGFTVVFSPGKVSLLINGSSVTFPHRTDPSLSGGIISPENWKFELICIWLAPLPAYV